MVKFSLSEVLSKAQAAKDRANRALSTARTKADEQKARALKNRAQNEIDKAKDIRSEINRIEAEKRRTNDEVKLRKLRKEKDDLRAEASYRGRIVTGIKGNIDKTIDQNLTKWGFPSKKKTDGKHKKRRKTLKRKSTQKRLCRSQFNYRGKPRR